MTEPQQIYIRCSCGLTNDDAACEDCPRVEYINGEWVEVD